MDLELQLMSVEDAEKKPVGPGRDAPEPMPPPQYSTFKGARSTSTLKSLSSK